jgi:hypothetical protein
LAQLGQFASLRERITVYWLDPGRRLTAGWRAHEDINDVMLATALVPEGFLVLRGSAPPQA